MLYWLTLLSDGGDFFNLFRYITFRAGGAFFTALMFGFIFGRPLINFLKRKQKQGQPIRSDGPESHLVNKIGTPTMGGLLILGALISSILLWARLDNGFVWVVLFVTLGFGLIGFIDDFSKVSNDNIREASHDDRQFISKVHRYEGEWETWEPETPILAILKNGAIKMMETNN